jgi:hypothetical protein
MSVRLLLEESYSGPNRRWRLVRSLFLLIGIAALSYSAWIYIGGYVHQRSESVAFDRARGSGAPADAAPVAAIHQRPLARV